MTTGCEVVSHVSCLLGESPVWDTGEKCIYWVDILPGDIHRYDVSTRQHQVMHAGQMVGAIALKKNGGLIAALQNGFATIDLGSGDVKVIADPEARLPANRFNDGKCDPGGRFWAGTMDDLQKKPGAGTLYCLNTDFSVSAKIRKVTCSNGLAWSPDKRTLYYIDTPTRQVLAFDYELKTGDITGKRVVIHIPAEHGFPDGMTIDTEGMLWIACWGGWKVGRWDPSNGTLLQNVFLPASQITSCTFGGEAMDELYITSAKTGLSDNDLKAEPLAGSLFVIRNSDFKGFPAFEFGPPD